MKTVKVMNKMMMKEMHKIQKKHLKSNQLSSGEMIFGSVTTDDSNSNNNTSIKQYI